MCKVKSSAVVSALLICILSACNKPQGKTESPAAQEIARVDPATAGSISGTVRFQGRAPAPQKIDMSQDAACGMQAGGSHSNLSEGYEVQSGHIANVLVYVKEGAPAGKFIPPTEMVTLDQRGCRYVPHVIALMVGQKLKITNSDMAIHNIHPASVKNAPFNESQMPGAAPMEKTFSQQEIMFPISCNQHPWMRAYASVLAHPFFAVTGADGSFNIKGLPPGDYTLAAVHERMGEKLMKVHVAAKQATRAEFSYSQADATR
jgi:hypothetical protein